VRRGIPHAELLESVARRIVDRRVLHLIKMWRESPVEETGADVDVHAIAIQWRDVDQAGRRGTTAIGVNVYTGSPC
jgi:hypothetical protein